MNRRNLAIAAVIMAAMYLALWWVMDKDIYHISSTMFVCTSYILLAKDGGNDG